MTVGIPGTVYLLKKATMQIRYSVLQFAQAAARRH